MYPFGISIKQEKPIGLKEIGIDMHDTIYPGLSKLPNDITLYNKHHV